MSYINKYKTNKNWANLAYEKNEYDIAVNRYYYSIFQKMLYELQTKTKGVVVPVDQQHNSHTNTAYQYAEQLIQGNNRRDTFKVKTSFNTGFNSLKGFRHRADYKEQHLTLVDVKKAKNYFVQLDEII